MITMNAKTSECGKMTDIEKSPFSDMGQHETKQEAGS